MQSSIVTTSAPRPSGAGVSARAARPAGVARAFTLLEVLLALGIIALLGTVLIGGSARLMSETPSTPSEVFWKSVQEARKAALKAEHDIRLKWDKEKKQFVLIDGLAPSRLAADGFTIEEAPLKQFPVLTAGSDLEVSFLASGKRGPAILVGGVLLESEPIEFVTFYSDGTCSPFRAQFMRGGAASILSIDPWTCAPVLTPADPYAPTS